MSRFLAFAFPVATAEEARQRIAETANRYHDARHCCWAYMIGADRQTWQLNDNGEPSGTAGKPILGQINSLGLTNVAIAVVRYFGGIKRHPRTYRGLPRRGPRRTRRRRDCRAERNDRNDDYVRIRLDERCHESRQTAQSGNNPARVRQHMPAFLCSSARRNRGSGGRASRRCQHLLRISAAAATGRDGQSQAAPKAEP